MNERDLPPGFGKPPKRPAKRYAKRLDVERSAMLTVKLTPAELATLKATAIERHGWLVSEYVRNLVNADQVGAVNWKQADERIARAVGGNMSRIRNVKTNRGES
mgnify:CR=1 FL=1